MDWTKPLVFRYCGSTLSVFIPRHIGAEWQKIKQGMREILPIWQQMLSTETLLRFGFSQGPTIPFLIGVYHFHGQLSDDDLNSKICLQKVFAEILDTGDGKVGITICTNLGVEIIRKIIFQSQNPITQENVSTHIDNIWETYGKYITTQRFSCDKEDN